MIRYALLSILRDFQLSSRLSPLTPSTFTVRSIIPNVPQNRTLQYLVESSPILHLQPLVSDDLLLLDLHSPFLHGDHGSGQAIVRGLEVYVRT